MRTHLPCAPRGDGAGPAPRAGAAAPRAARRARSRRRRRRGRWAGFTGRASPGLPAPGPPRRGGLHGSWHPRLAPGSSPRPVRVEAEPRDSFLGGHGENPAGSVRDPQARGSGRPQATEIPGSPGPRVGMALAGAARSRALPSRLSPQPGAAPAPHRPGISPGFSPSATERDALLPAASRRHRHRLLGETRAAAGGEAGGALRVPVRVPSPAESRPARGSMSRAGTGTGAGSGPWRAAAVTGLRCSGPGPPPAGSRHRDSSLRVTGRRSRGAEGRALAVLPTRTPVAARAPSAVLLGEIALIISRCSGRINGLRGAWPASRPH